jgi:hypothetical protein
MWKSSQKRVAGGGGRCSGGFEGSEVIVTHNLEYSEMYVE